MVKFVSGDAEKLLKNLLDTKDGKKYIDDKFTSFGSDTEASAAFRTIIDELVENHLVMCTWYAGTIHEAKIPISAEKYFEEKEKVMQEKEEKRKEEQRLLEEKRLLEEAKKEKERRKKESKEKKEAELNEKIRREEEDKIREKIRREEEVRIKEESRIREKIRREDEVRLKEQARLKEEAHLKEGVRLKEEARLKDEARLKEGARLKEEARLEDEARLREAAELYKEAGIDKSAPVLSEGMFAQIAQQIDASGGADKEAMHYLLDEAKEIIEEIILTRRIPKRKRFFSEMVRYSKTQGWFYSTVISVIGKASLDLLGQ